MLALALTALGLVACGTPRQSGPPAQPAEPVPAAIPPVPQQSPKIPRTNPPVPKSKTAPSPKIAPPDSVDGGRIIWQSGPIAAP